MASNWKPIHSVAFFGLTGAIFLTARLVEPTPFGWYAIMILMTLFVVVMGHGVTGVFRGAWIDDRNKLSLSQFQLLIWTVLALSAYMMAAFWNLRTGVAGGTTFLDALDIAIPVEVWALLGISVASFAGSPMIKNAKKAKEPTTGAASDAEGVLVKNPDNRKASWGDLFTGEEVQNRAQFDVGKAQMFFFTMVIAFAYGRALFFTLDEAVAASTRISQFPEISDSIVMLLGISHTGYLTYKAVPHTRTAEPAPPAPEA